MLYYFPLPLFVVFLQQLPFPVIVYRGLVENMQVRLLISSSPPDPHAAGRAIQVTGAEPPIPPG